MRITPETARNLTVPSLEIDALMGRTNRPLRGRIERRIVATLCEYLTERGWTPCKVHGGDDGPEPCNNTKSAMEFVFNLDDSTIVFCNATGTKHGVAIVLGNGEDCISDWGFTDGDLDGFNALMDAFLDLIPTLV